MIQNNNSSEKKNVLILGASFNTGNLGVSALAESTIQCILHSWPNANITIFGGTLELYEEKRVIRGREVVVKNIPIRFSKNIFLEAHIIRYYLYGVMRSLLHFHKPEQSSRIKNPCIREIVEADIVVDITGGDSFSDIYGMIRFIKSFLEKLLVVLYKKPLIFLPQTYGPFKKRLIKSMAGYILKKALAIYSRDRDGIDFLRQTFKSARIIDKIAFMPDVAFTLEPRKPEKIDVDSLFDAVNDKSILVGLNISGLIYYGGYSRDNMFDLKVNYKELIHDIIESLLMKKNVLVLLIPHIFPDVTGHVEDDTAACLEVYTELVGKYKKRLFLARGKYDHKEIKYVIGKTNYFIGTRMHSCIAALSQGIPAIGLAYSKKFKGVFETVGAEKYVADMRFDDQKEIVMMISRAYDERKVYSQNLKQIMPEIKQKVFNLFNNLA